MLYPYHLSDVIVKGLRVTPFIYYINMMSDIMTQERSYDSLPNFTAADCKYIHVDFLASRSSLPQLSTYMYSDQHPCEVIYTINTQLDVSPIASLIITADSSPIEYLRGWIFSCQLACGRMVVVIVCLVKLHEDMQEGHLGYQPTETDTFHFRPS